MKLLLENWRQFINEEEASPYLSLRVKDAESKYLGDWLTNIPKVHQELVKGLRGGGGLLPNPVHETTLAKLGYEFVGSGGGRYVVRPKGDDKFIIKFIKDKGKAFQNEVEHKYQTSFKNLFPKVYKHGPGAFGTDWDWIVVEAVPKLFRSHRELIPYFPELEKLIDKYIPNKDSRAKKEFGVFLNSVIWFIRFGRPRTLYSWLGVNPQLDLNSEEGEEVLEKLSKDILDATNKNHALRDLASLTSPPPRGINVELGELRLDNFGATADGRFVIVDASIFKDEKGRRYVGGGW